MVLPRLRTNTLSLEPYTVPQVKEYGSFRLLCSCFRFRTHLCHHLRCVRPQKPHPRRLGAFRCWLYRVHDCHCHDSCYRWSSTLWCRFGYFWYHVRCRFRGSSRSLPCLWSNYRQLGVWSVIAHCSSSYRCRNDCRSRKRLEMGLPYQVHFGMSRYHRHCSTLLRKSLLSLISMTLLTTSSCSLPPVLPPASNHLARSSRLSTGLVTFCFWELSFPS